MTKVLDSNVLTYIASGDPVGLRAIELIETWLRDGEALHAPALASYEIANGLSRLVAAGMFPLRDVPTALAKLEQIPITWHLAHDLAAIVTIADRLGRHSAYDAAYLALAQELNAEVWTFDGPLARNAASVGFPVHLIARS